MNPLTVIVNDIELDLFEDTDFYITEQIHDLTDLQTRNASFARTLDVPITATNKQALEESFPIFPNQRKAIAQLPAKILFKGIPFVNNALASAAVDDGSYSIAFSFKTFDFYERIQGKLVSELNWSDLDFTFDQPGYGGNSQQTKDLVTALTQWFDSDNLNDESIPINSSFRLDHDLNFSGFHLYLKSIARRIVEDQGFAFDDLQMIDEPDYETLTLACPVTKFADIREIPNPLQGVVTNLLTQIETTGNTPLTARIVFDNVVTDPGGLWNAVSYQWDFIGTNTIDVALTLAGDYVQNAGGTQVCELRLVLNGNIIDLVDVADEGTFNTAILRTIEVENGDSLWGEIYIERQGTLTLTPGNQFSITESGFNLNRDINISDFIPDITQQQFLQSLAAYYNAFIDTDEPSNTISLIPYDDIITGTEQDLTDNADTLRPEERVYSLPYFQESIFKYADGNTRRSDQNTLFIFSDQLLEKRGVLIELAFEASDNSIFDSSLYTRGNPNQEVPAYKMDHVFENLPSITTVAPNTFSLAAATEFKAGDYIELSSVDGFGNLEVARIASRTSNTTGTVQQNWTNIGADANWSLYKFEIEDPGIRIGNIIDSQGLYDVYYGGAPKASIGSGLEARFTSSMIFSNILNANYANLLNALSTPFLLRAWFTFTPAEFEQLDLTQKVYLKHYGTTFILNKAEQYNPKTQLVRLELIRV